MTGIVSGVDYSVLFGSNTTDPSTAILNALYNPAAYTSVTTAASSGSPLTDLKMALKNEKTDVAKEAKLPEVARDIAAFKKAVANSKTVDKALSNPAILKVLLTANNLASNIPYPGLAKKVLMSDPSDPHSVVSKMSDPAWKNAAKTFNFVKNGLSALTDPKVIATLTDGYAEVMWRQSLNKATPGLANALAFLQQAKSITSVDQILGNQVARTVVTTALGLPQQIAYQELRAQETAITSRLDITKLQDSKFVTSLTDKYLLMVQQQNMTSSNGLLSLTGGGFQI